MVLENRNSSEQPPRRGSNQGSKLIEVCQRDGMLGLLRGLCRTSEIAYAWLLGLGDNEIRLFDKPDVRFHQVCMRFGGANHVR